MVPRIVVVGAGFGGLAATKALSKAPAEIMLIDRTNHHLLQLPRRYVVSSRKQTPNSEVLTWQA